MRHSYRGPVGLSRKIIRLGWRLLAGMAGAMVLSWYCQGILLVNRLAPLALGGLALICLATWTMRRTRVGC